MSVTSHTAARELGAGLLRLRTAAGLTTRALGAHVGASHSNISNWEKGSRLISEDRLSALLDVLKPQSDDERERLLGLRRQAEARGDLTAGAPAIGPRLARLIEQEQVARKITDVALALIPGLLQTSGYARAILGEDPDRDTKVALRMGRRDVLTRSIQPVELHALIDEGALIRPIAAPDVMRDQLSHLLKMSELPNVTIQLVPSTSQGFSPHLVGAFILLEFPTAGPVVHLEHHWASVSLWEPEDVRHFAEAVELVAKMAMTPANSVRTIEELVKGMETR
jgi:transcriptional regulator with XRE-family HTH domain